MDNFKTEMQKDAEVDLPKKDPEKDPIIKIMGILPGSTDLILSDDGYTVADKNTTVTWIIETNQVLEITGIETKDKSEEVFKEDERPKRDSKKQWSGKTKDKFHHKDGKDYVREHYTFRYIDYSNNEERHDPIIQVNA